MTFYTKIGLNQAFMAKTSCSWLYWCDFRIFLCVEQREATPHPIIPPAVTSWSMRFCKSPGYTPGRLKHELWVVVDKKERAFVKMTKTWQFRQPVLPRAFSGEKHAQARAFNVKYDQNYGLWSIKSAPASPGRSRAGPSLYVFSLLGFTCTLYTPLPL